MVGLRMLEFQSSNDFSLPTLGPWSGSFFFNASRLNTKAAPENPAATQIILRPRSRPTKDLFCGSFVRNRFPQLFGAVLPKRDLLNFVVRAMLPLLRVFRPS